MKVNKYNKCSGGGGTTCNLEDKRVTPSMVDRDVNNLIVVEESEGYDGLSRVVIDPQTIYNEGINEQKTKLEAINITENGTYTKEDGYNQIEVNVNAIPKVNIQEAGINFAYSTFTEVPEWADFNGVTNMNRMFQNCSNLQTIPEINTSNVTNMSNMFGACNNLRTIPLIDTSNVTDMSYMFANCGNLQTIPLLNTSNVTDMSYMFYNCPNLKTIPLIDTSNVNSMYYMFNSCGNLQTIPLLNTSNVTNMNYMFSSCGNLRTLPELDASKVTTIKNYFRSSGSKLTDVGGWKNLKINWDDNYGLVLCPNLTYQSCINILNGLYDFVGNGSTETRTLKVHQNFLTTVGDEISIGTNKGWTITV